MMPLVVRIKIFLLMIASAASATRVDIRGGFGERRPGLEYDTAAPLFDFNVLVTGVHTEGQSRRMAAASPNLVSRRCRWSCALVDHFETKCGATKSVEIRRSPILDDALEKTRKNKTQPETDGRALRAHRFSIEDL